jgi:uncharacterized protein with PIN domain
MTLSPAKKNLLTIGLLVVLLVGGATYAWQHLHHSGPGEGFASGNGRIEATEVEQLLLALRVEVMPFDQHQLHWALEGWRRYGKGRHPAGLNLGDCFSYGLAMALDLPLLFKGDDFSLTNVKVAVL